MRFAKSLRDLTRDDILGLIGEPEREDLEFKSELSRNKQGDEDPWYKNQEKLSDRAKHDLATEVVAFANRNGGTLILGIAETSSRPRTADRIAPLPKPRLLAEHLLRSLHAIIEPPLPSLEVVGLPSGSNDEGVVIIGVGQSRSAPHRVNMSGFDRECYIRRNDECIKMDMRSIHDLVIERMRFSSAINEAFAERSVDFRELAKNGDGSINSESGGNESDQCAGFRFTSLPMHTVQIADITRSREYAIPTEPVHYTIPSGLSGNRFQIASHQFRPVLRGWLGSDVDGVGTVQRLITGFGVLEDRVLIPPSLGQEKRIFANWILQKLADHLRLIESFRRRIGQDFLEYGTEIEIRLPSGWRLIERGGEYNEGHQEAKSKRDFVKLHRVSVGQTDEFPTLFDQLQNDLWNAFGQTPVSLKRPDFDQLLST